MTGDDIGAVLRERAPAALDLLGRLVNIDSGVGQTEGLDAVRTEIRSQCEAIGFDVADRPSNGAPPTLLATRRSPHLERPHVLMLGHLDTVFPPGTVADRPFQVTDGRAAGPGVADMKGGLVVMLEALRAVDALGHIDDFHFSLLFNADEESGSSGSRETIEAVAGEADLVLVFEPGRPDGSVVTSRRGLRRYRVHVKGRAAHSGVDPETGASAVTALARKIVAMEQLTDHARRLSVNVGVIRGGSRPNIVPDSADAEIDVRLADTASEIAVDKAMHAIIAATDVPGTAATAELFAHRPPLTEAPSLAPVLRVYAETAERLGIEWRTSWTGGGSDGNFTAALGVPTLDGLGPVGGGYHTEHEFIHVSSLPQRAALSAGALVALAETGWRRR